LGRLKTAQPSPSFRPSPLTANPAAPSASYSRKNRHFCAFFCVFCLKTAKKNLKICIIEDKIVSLQQIIRQSQESIWKQQGKKEHARKSVQPLGLLCVKEKKNKGLLK